MKAEIILKYPLEDGIPDYRIEVDAHSVSELESLAYEQQKLAGAGVLVNFSFLHERS